MNLFFIGDVHGCFHTLSTLLKRWKPATDHLIQVGDLVARGNYVPETVALARQLSEQYPATTTFLMGNHEAEMLHHYGPQGPSLGWLKWGGRSTTEQYRHKPKLLAEHLPWLQQRPLLWQNDHVLASHAGISAAPDAYEPTSANGLLWARGPLKRLDKLQVVGHTPMDDGEPIHDPDSHTMYIDTGAVFGRNLTGLRLSPTGAVLDIILIPVDPRDLPV
ncbi:serine/threonine protein phosphatase [Hymenobacter sp. DH14]|uniref:Serine/threonine protein phosphatase n=1 Tax=Hymenobacter cyanobacteriorum TaxID=2926463 RepID=A0A9X1VFD9_9BACT|nr:metallophosphoesterase family protein [Hymenobacter cyanobacteriorum]MCI1187068.1 serine/threonine protein phosphatase [Hymenobacter cyanobacteriorum]